MPRKEPGLRGRGLVLMLVAASAALVSCALLSGAGDLTFVDLDGASTAHEADVDAAVGPTGEGGTDALDAGADAQRSDASPAPPCDETSLRARWTLDEGAGTAVHDCTSARHDGTLAGGAWTSGERDGGLSFDGGWASFGNPSDFQIAKNLSVCAWIFPTEVPIATGRGYIVAKLSSPTGGGWRLAIGRSASARLIEVSMNVPGGEAGFNEVSAGEFPPDVWTHVCGVFQSSTITLYVNGLQVTSSPIDPQSITFTPDELRIGTRSDGINPFVGGIDDVRLYDRALTAPAVKALAQP